MHTFYITAVRSDGIPVRYRDLSYAKAGRLFDQLCTQENIVFAMYGDEETENMVNTFCRGAEFK